LGRGGEEGGEEEIVEAEDAFGAAVGEYFLSWGLFGVGPAEPGGVFLGDLIRRGLRGDLSLVISGVVVGGAK